MLNSGLGMMQQQLLGRGGNDDRLQWTNAAPESVVGTEVVISGELTFDKLLKIDGRFEGKIVTKGGNLIIGPSGVLVGDVNNVSSMLVEGKVTGNILVETLLLRGDAVVHGDVSCKSITIDPKVVICGNVNVHPQAPKFIDSNGNIVAAPPRPAPIPSRKPSLKAPVPVPVPAAAAKEEKKAESKPASAPKTAKKEEEKKAEPAPAPAKTDEGKKAEPAKTEEKKTAEPAAEKSTPHIEPAPADPAASDDKAPASAEGKAEEPTEDAPPA